MKAKLLVSFVVSKAHIYHNFRLPRAVAEKNTNYFNNCVLFNYAHELSVHASTVRHLHPLSITPLIFARFFPSTKKAGKCEQTRATINRRKQRANAEPLRQQWGR